MYEAYQEPGTPYDWENPDSYIPPHWVADEVVESHKIWRMVAIAGLGILGLTSAGTSVGVATGLLPAHVEATPENPAPQNLAPLGTCPKDTSALLSYSRSSAEAAVAEMQFPIDGQQYGFLSEQINEAPDNATVERLLNGVVAPFGIHVSIGVLPQKESASGPSVLTHTPNDLTLDEVKTAADGLLLGLARVPNTLLEKATHNDLNALGGLDIFISKNIVAHGTPVGGLFTATSSLKKPVILLGTTDADIDFSRTAFEHELSHALDWAECGNAVATNDIEYSSLNPSNFRYSDDAQQHFTAYANGTVISEYAAKNFVEDDAETGKFLFENGLVGNGFTCTDFAMIARNSTVCQKLQLLIERQAVVVPDISAYYLYLSYADADEKSFPADAG